MSELSRALSEVIKCRGRLLKKFFSISGRISLSPRFLQKNYEHLWHSSIAVISMLFLSNVTTLILSTLNLASFFSLFNTPLYIHFTNLFSTFFSKLFSTVSTALLTTIYTLSLTHNTFPLSVLITITSSTLF